MANDKESKILTLLAKLILKQEEKIKQTDIKKTNVKNQPDIKK